MLAGSMQAAEEIAESVAALKVNVEKRNELRKRIADLREASGLAELEAELEDVDNQVRSSISEIERLALEAYGRDGNPRPWPGVAIRLNSRLRISDVAGAIRWAFERGKFSLLTIDEQEAKRVLARCAPVDWGYLFYEPTVTLSTELREGRTD